MALTEISDLAGQLSPELSSHSATDSDEALIDAPQAGTAPEVRALDRHTAAFLKLVRDAIAGWKPPTPEGLPLPQRTGKLPHVPLPFGGLQLPSGDEDWPDQPFLRVAALRAMRSYLFPFKDVDARWESRARARAVLQAELPAGTTLPHLVTPWEEMSSDAALSRYAFAGLGSLRLMPLPEPDAEGAAWVSDWSFMAGLEVRPGFERYGAVAWFNAAQEPVRIHWSHANKVVRPGDPDWNHAKWVWRTTVFVGTTVVDHLVGVHWLVSSHITAAVRENLGTAHPVRRLLQPHTFRTITINYNSTFSLYPEWGFVHRACSLTAESLITALGAGVEMWRYTTVPEVMARKRAEHLGEDFPFVVDGLALWKVVRDHVERYLALYYQGDDAIRDREILAMWEQIGRVRKNISLPPLTLSSLIDLLAQFIWTVTGLHEAVGAVVECVVDPTFVGTRLRPGTEMSDIQATFQGLLIMGLTGLQQPSILGDFTHVALDDAGKAAFRTFQAELTGLADQIDQKNKTRKYPYNGFNPRNLECSVSI